MGRSAFGVEAPGNKVRLVIRLHEGIVLQEELYFRATKKASASLTHRGLVLRLQED